MTLITRTDDNPAVFEHAAHAVALSSPTDDGINHCAAALDAAERGVLVSESRRQEREPQGAVEKTKKQIGKAVEDLGGSLLKGLFGT